MNSTLAIVVTYNSIKWADRCFSSLACSSVPLDVLVVDNGSTDGTIEYLKEHFPEFQIHETGNNLGFGAANNIGLKNALKSGYDYVYLMNSDAWIFPDTIGQLIEASQKDRKYGILSPMQMSADMLSLDSRFARWYGKRGDTDNISGICELPFVMAAHWLITREALEAVGGFSPSFRLYGEDDNYIDRLHFFGYAVGVLPSAKAVHDRAGRSSTKAQKMNLKTIATVVKVSDPNRRFGCRFIREIFELAGMAVKNFSFKPICFIPELLRRRKELQQNRLISTSETAFLNSKQSTDTGNPDE